jgi:hypothetical protein
MWYLKRRADFPEVTDGETPAGSRPHGTCPTPSPVRQGMAGSFALGIGILLLLQLGTDALVLQALLLAALAALIFGRFRQASFLHHFLRGKSDFARGTLPWKRGPFCPAPSNRSEGRECSSGRFVMGGRFDGKTVRTANPVQTTAYHEEPSDKVESAIAGYGKGKMARLGGLEPPTRCLEGSCSIRLSYRRAK